MSSVSPHRRELLDLLDRLCEDWLGERDRVRLEELVAQDDAALQTYLDYIALHGTLYWDTAIGDDAPLIKPTASATSPDRQPHRSSRRRSWVMATACLALVAVAAVIFLPPQSDVVVENTSPVTHQDGTITVPNESTITATDQTTSPPVVRLDRVEPSPSTNDVTMPTPDYALVGSDGSVNDRGAQQTPTDIVSFIDEQLAAHCDAADVIPSPMADDAEWLRRASLDLSGRIPSLDRVRTFLASEDANKREQFITTQLQGGDFAEHLTTTWANLLVGRSREKSQEREGLEQFLLSQFRQNRPWNETVGELIAAEGSVDENGAAGFLLAHLNNEAVPATAITARVFLGEQVQCTQCHKHPWNDESQEQFWSLNAFFHQTDIEHRASRSQKKGQSKTVPVLVTRAVGGPTYFENLNGVMQVAYPKFGGATINPDATVNRRRELARLLSDGDDHQLAKAFVNRMWAHFFGYGFVNPVDDMGPHHPVTHAELLDRLAAAFAASGYNINELVRWITSSHAYQRSSRLTEGNAIDDPSTGVMPLFSRMYVKPLSPEELFDSVLVATDADRADHLYGSESIARRKVWVQQFFEVLENEENGEVSTFDGTLPQALTMMNGPLVQTALSGDAGTVLHRVLSSPSTDAEKVRQLALATLTRAPTEKERNLFIRHVRQAGSRPAKVDAFRDVFWTYLNSSEFVVNH